ncbi:MAG: hypothetical protein PHU77_05480 [Simplicispira sp.]|nr:hypothetical protein [Simplicispira sp.]
MTKPAQAAAAATAFTAPTALALHDDRPFFEKALAYGVQHGIIDAAALQAMHTDAPKGIVQIARYFGNEFLRPELEKARARMVNLISLYLQESCDGDLQAAAQSLRQHSLLSRSKGGSDMLRRLIALPESSHFGMAGSDEAHIPLLALWSLRSHADYRAELARRTHIAQAIDAALWLVAQYGLEADHLEEAGTDAEAVIRAALLWRAMVPQASAWPTTPALQKVLAALRKKRGTGALPALALQLPSGLPAHLHAVVQAEFVAVQVDWPRCMDSAQPLRTLLSPLGRLRARYFLLDDPLAEMQEYEQQLAVLTVLGEGEGGAPAQPASKTWLRLTQGVADEHALLTLFLCIAAGTPKKTLLTEKTATSLVRKIRTHGWQPALAHDFIAEHAPGAFQKDYCALWDSFVQESQKTLFDDHDVTRGDALALLRRECHVAG